MTVLLGLEAIGDDTVAYVRLIKHEVRETLGGELGAAVADHIDPHPRRPWVAEIIGHHPVYRFERKFLHGNRDYSRANSVGSRGVYLYYRLNEGRIYEVNDLVSWARTDRYFCRILASGESARMTEEEVDACLNAG